MTIDQYPEWKSAVEQLARSEATVLVFGDTDAGKTTFCTLLVNAALEGGRRVAVVDADIGQSEVGPPCCVGMAVPEVALTMLSEARAAAVAFVGSTSPRGHLLEHATATRVMADSARESNPALLIVDTTGFIAGPGARRLKQAKMELLRPTRIVCLERAGECGPLLAPLRGSEGTEVIRLPVAAAIRRKPPAVRAQRRAARFAVYFEQAETHRVRMDDVAFIGTWINQAPPLAPHLQRFVAGALGRRVYHAEMGPDRHLGIVAGAQPEGDRSLALLHEQFRPRAITITPSALLGNLILGLRDPKDRFASLGLLESIDFGARVLSVRAPLRSAASIRRVAFGSLRVRPDGTELGTVRPTDL